MSHDSYHIDIATEIVGPGESSWLDGKPVHLFMSLPEELYRQEEPMIQLRKDRTTVVRCTAIGNNLHEEDITLFKNGYHVDESKIGKYREYPGSLHLLYVITGT